MAATISPSYRLATPDFRNMHRSSARSREAEARHTNIFWFGVLLMRFQVRAASYPQLYLSARGETWPIGMRGCNRALHSDYTCT